MSSDLSLNGYRIIGEKMEAWKGLVEIIGASGTCTEQVQFAHFSNLLVKWVQILAYNAKANNKYSH